MSDNTPQNPSQGQPAEPPSLEPPVQPPEQGDQPGEIRMPKDAFDRRLERASASAQRKLIEEMGFQSIDDWREFKKLADERVREEEERRKAEMTEIERLKAEHAESLKVQSELKAAKEQADAQLEAARVEAHLLGVFGELGIKNSEYAFFKLEKHLDTLKDDEDFDEREFLQKLLENDSEKVALGFASPSVPSKPAGTTPKQDGPPPKTEEGPSKKAAQQMSDEEWMNHQRALGLL